MANSTQYVCVKDRMCFAVPHDYRNGSWHCPICGEPGVQMYYTWRPPKKNNDKAWAKIEKGDFYWEKDHKYDAPGRLQESMKRQNRYYGVSRIGELLELAYRKKRKQHSW